jgi:DNA-binding response OmpR family regulator
MIPGANRVLMLQPPRPNRVLLVEGDGSLLPSYFEVLSDHGYAVTAASNGSQADLRAIGDRPFDLLITDFNMPGINGLELALRMTLRQPDLPVLLIADERLDECSAAIARTRSWRFLRKPIESGNLVLAACHLISRAASRVPGINEPYPSRSPISN